MPVLQKAFFFRQFFTIRFLIKENKSKKKKKCHRKETCCTKIATYKSILCKLFSQAFVFFVLVAFALYLMMIFDQII